MNTENQIQPDELRINSNRLEQLLRDLSEIGKDPRGGTTRVAFSKEDQAGREWVIEKILDEPISELSVFDLDDDEDEIVAIQPFHGSTVCIYKRRREGWSRVFETGTELGHGIWAGKIGGVKGFVLGSRAGKQDFCLYSMEASGTWKMKKHVIDRGTGTAQLDAIHEKDHDLIVSTNNYTNEIALYTVK